MHARIINYWRDLNLWLLEKTWQKSRVYYVTPTSLNRVQEKEPTQNGILQADKCYIFCRLTQRKSHGLQNHCISRSSILKSIPLGVWHLRRILESRTMKICVPLELLCCICMQTRDSWKKLRNYSIYSSKKMVGLILKTFEVFYANYCSSGGYCSGW